jgi:hypothetical protein
MLLVQLHPLPVENSLVTTLEETFRRFSWSKLAVEGYHTLLTDSEFLKNFTKYFE